MRYARPNAGTGAVTASRRWLAFLLMIAIVGAGCSSNSSGALGDDSSVAKSTDSGPDSTGDTSSAGGSSEVSDNLAEVNIAQFEPTFDEEPCDLSLPPEPDIRCGVVSVPSNWDDGSGTIDLAVAVVNGPSGSATGPVINLEGGPGGHSLQTMTYVVDDIVKPLAESGDVVFFDQRGTGLSRPRLNCEELTAMTRRHEDDVDLDDDDAVDEFHETLEACRDRLLEEGAVLVDYNSINNAHDVEAIRLALGYDEWNLLGVSYGTKLALEIMRQHPSGIRSVILDSVYPPQVDSTRDNPSTFLASYAKVVEACASEPECAATGDLADRLRAVILELEKAPIRLEVTDWVTGATDEVYADGNTVAQIVTSALYSPSQIVDLPKVVEQLENGQTDGLASFLSQERTSEQFFTDGMFYAVACQEEISFADRAEVEAALPDDPFGLDDKLDLASNTGTNAFDTCAAFENGSAPASSNSAVTSSIPALLMAGDFDPVTPTAWAELAAETLPNSYVVVSKNGSHGLSSDACGMSIVTEFLNTPQTKPDAGCFDEETLNFIARSPKEVSLEEFSIDIGSGKTLSSVRPHDWRIGTLGGDQYRDGSFLDQTVLFQISADPNLALGLEQYVEQGDISLGKPETFVGSAGPITAKELDRTWTRRQGTGTDARAEWFETTIDSQPVQVVLVSSNEEYEANLEAIVLPVLMTIEVS